MHADMTALPARTAFLRRTARHEVAAGMGLAELAMWYAHENVAFDDSVSALAERAAGDATAVRVAYEYLAFAKLSHSSHTQVMALFMMNELRRRVERACHPRRGLTDRMAAIWERLEPARGARQGRFGH